MVSHLEKKNIWEVWAQERGLLVRKRLRCYLERESASEADERM